MLWRHFAVVPVKIAESFRKNVNSFARSILRRKHGSAALFGFVTLLQLVPVWFTEYLPTGDGPSHLYGAWLLRRLAFRTDNGAISRFYHVDWSPVPNWAANAVMAAAMSIASPLAAEKFFFSVVIVVFLLGAWTFAGADD